ncbi:lytic transglycosylase domain-containing protein [bacterium]|nr:lytic transglycosylase domain-containing protein [bacterium]
MHNIKSITQKDRYGNMFSLEMFEDQGVPMIMMIPDMANGFNGADTDNHPGNPKGTDTVPAWLTPGENVVNAEASRIPGNQEKIDQMNDQGRQMQAAQGGPIPSYAADGGMVPQYHYDGTGQDDYSPYDVPSWFTPDILENLIQTESGNNNQAVNSKSGATGAAQIMSDTALDPGYNVQPITLEQRKDPYFARQFATQYIAGIQKEHPDWTPSQVLQAYNAGPGRLATSIAGKGKPLTQETIDYPAKILGENFIPPRPDSLADQRNVSLQKFNKKAITNNLKIAQDSFDVLENKRKENISMGRPEFDKINKYTYDGSKKALAYQQQQLADTTEEVEAIRPKNTSEFVESIISQTDTGPDVDDQPNNQPNTTVTQTGIGAAKQDPGFLDDTINLFKEVLGDMFSGKDIARMAINYIGSRAMGYEHNGSLNYAMKDFADREETRQKQEFDLIKANASNYTVASYNKYIQTRDVNVLIKKSGKTVPGDYYIIPGMSGMQASVNVDGVPMVDVKVDGKVVRVNAAELGAKKVRDENSPIKLAESFDKAATTAFKRVNKNIEEAQQLVPLTSLGGQARDLVEADIVREGSDTTNQGRIRTAMKRAIDKYADAMRRYANDPSSFQGRNPSNSLEVFYRQERISVDNPGFDNKLIKDADPYKLADLMNTVQAEVDQEQDDAKAEFNIMSKQWKKIIERKRQNSSYDMGGFDSERNDGHTPFTWWMTQIYANNPTAEQLYNDNK